MIGLRQSPEFKHSAVRVLLTFLASGLAGSLPGAPVEAQWRVETTPFLWASGMDGEIRVRQFTGDLDIGSDFTWQALGWVGYRFNRQLTLRGGYRHFDIDIEDEDENFRYDITLSGLMIGASVNF